MVGVVPDLGGEKRQGDKESWVLKLLVHPRCTRVLVVTSKLGARCLDPCGLSGCRLLRV